MATGESYSMFVHMHVKKLQLCLWSFRMVAFIGIQSDKRQGWSEKQNNDV